MNRRRTRRTSARRTSRAESHLVVENLEGRIVLTASIGFDARQGLVSVVGSEAGDVATVNVQGRNVVVSLTGVASRTFRTAQVRSIDFKGLGGDDSFTNNTAIRSRADGGVGDDTLRGGSGVDDLRGGADDDRLFGNGNNDVLSGGTGDDTLDGGAGNDREYGDAGDDDIYGGTGNDALYGGADDDDIYGDIGNDGLYGEAGDDILDGRSGRDRIVGGTGLDREDDADDRFEDGDSDGDGYDNDHDRPVNPGLATAITFTETAPPGVSTARLTGESTGERDRDYYSFTAAATRTLTITVVADANGRFADVEVKDGTTGRKLLELEPTEDGIATAQMRVVAGTAYVLKVESPFDHVAVGYTVDLTLDDTPISPIIGTEIVFDSTGFARLTGTVADDTRRIYSFTATASGSLNVTIRPGAAGRYAQLELKNRTTGQTLLELEPAERRGRTTGTVAVVAGQTYVIEIESADEGLPTDFAVELQLS